MNPIRISDITIGFERDEWSMYKGSNPALCRMSILPNVYRPIEGRLYQMLYE
jgi:hypothetical protein